MADKKPRSTSKPRPPIGPKEGEFGQRGNVQGTVAPRPKNPPPPSSSKPKD